MDSSNKKTRRSRKTIAKPSLRKAPLTTQYKQVEKKTLTPKGCPPQAMVITRYGLAKKNRLGRGYSVIELKAVDIPPARAVNLGLKVDRKRKSKHPDNVKRLKDYCQLE